MSDAAPLAYRVEAAAEAIGVSRSMVWKLIADKKLPARKVGRSTVIRREDLQAFIDATEPQKAAQSAMR